MAVVLILEDDSRRIERFRRVLQTILPESHVKFWTSAKQMIEDVESHLADASLISLDHDLYSPEKNQDDLGDGWEVAQHLATQLPVCPIIIHTSNSERALWMEGELELAHWTVKRVAPFGDDWIETHWSRVARGIILPE